MKNNRIYLLLGSNMGNSQDLIGQAKKHIAKQIGPIGRESGLYQTAAWGNTQQPDFLNQVIFIETTLTPMQVMIAILDIEKKMGRIRTVKNAPRIIDIDILFYNKMIIDEEDLQVPHPQISTRRFVLVPLKELSPLFIHPVLQKTIHQLLRVCPDKLAVKKN